MLFLPINCIFGRILITMCCNLTECHATIYPTIKIVFKFVGGRQWLMVHKTVSHDGTTIKNPLTSILLPIDEGQAHIV